MLLLLPQQKRTNGADSLRKAFQLAQYGINYTEKEVEVFFSYAIIVVHSISNTSKSLIIHYSTEKRLMEKFTFITEKLVHALCLLLFLRKVLLQARIVIFIL